MKVHPAAALFPMMSDEDLADLAEDIKTNGQIHTIIVDADGQLIDGRNRLAACQLAGVEPRVETLTGQDPAVYILSSNVTRRHLSKGQAAMLVARVRLETKQAMPLRAAAKTAGTSAARVSQANTVLKYAPELVDWVQAGGHLDQAYAIALERKQRDEDGQDADNLMGYAERELERVRDRARRTTEEIGAPVPIPPEPRLEILLLAAGEIFPRVDGELAALDAERAILQPLIEIRRELEAVLAEPVIEEPWGPSMSVSAIRSAVSQIVALAYGIADKHNRAYEDRTRAGVRRVK